MDNADFEAKISSLLQRVRTHLEGAPGCHDFDHTLRVLRNAESLASETPGADLRIVRLAALLHDLARPEEMRLQGRACHARLGAAMIPEFVADCDFPPVLVAAVAEAVRTHRYRDDARPRTVEGKIVYDADKLDSLGAVGVGRAFLFAGRAGARLHNTAQEALASPPYSREDTAYREYLVKLRKLPAAMLTEAGRAAAAERVVFMKEFFRRLHLECGQTPSWEEEK